MLESGKIIFNRLFEKKDRRKKALMSLRDMKRIVKEFEKNAQPVAEDNFLYRIHLITGDIWPVDNNETAIIEKVVNRFACFANIDKKNPLYEDVKNYFSRVDTLVTPAMSYEFPMLLDGKHRLYTIVTLRPFTQEEWNNNPLTETLCFGENHRNFSEFVLYHELFHTFGEDVHVGDYADLHREELFCDFAACLTMASRGHEDIFLQIAKWRALDLKQYDLQLYDINDDDVIETLNPYYNYHLYGIYKTWRKSNPDLDIAKLSQDDIIHIARDVVRDYAFTESQLIEFSVARAYEAKNNLSTDDERSQYLEEIMDIADRPIKKWQKDYRLAI